MRRYFQVISNTVAFLAPSRLMQSRRGLLRRIHQISRVIRAFSQGRIWNIQQHDRQGNIKAPVAKISALGPFQTAGPVNGRDFLFPADGVFPQPRFTLISRRAPDFQQRRIDPRKCAFAGHRRFTLPSARAASSISASLPAWPMTSRSRRASGFLLIRKGLGKQACVQRTPTS